MLATNTSSYHGSTSTRWVGAGLACLAAVPWGMLAAGASTSLIVWVPAALVSIAFAIAFLIVAVGSLRGRRRIDLVLVGLLAFSLVTLLYAPALAMGGPISGAPESVACPSSAGICWNYLHSAFKVQAAVLVAALVLTGKVQLAAREWGLTPR